jgi:hypothetical protein
MPYKNVHYIKVMLELLDDKRFIKDCDDSQKLDYLLWLCMAGLTQNDAENNPEWFKTRFNLQKKSEEIAKNVEFISKTFPKVIIANGRVKFKNFKKLHNPIRNADGTPKDSPKNAKNIIDKNRLDKIILEYIKLQGWEETIKNNALLVTDIYSRNCKPAKQLLLTINNDDLAYDVLRKIAGDYKTKCLNWTLETVLKHLPELLKAVDKKFKYKAADQNCKVCGGSGWIYVANESATKKCDCTIGH